MAPAAVFLDLSGGGKDLVGPDAFKQFYREFLQEFPKFHVNVRDIKITGEYQSGTVDVTTIDKDTKTPIRFSVPVNIRVKDDQVIEARNYIDTYCWEHRAAI